MQAGDLASNNIVGTTTCRAKGTTTVFAIWDPDVSHPSLLPVAGTN